MDATFEQHLSEPQRSLINSLKTPYDIQAYLDQVAYAAEYDNRCPVSVMRDNRGHCLDGAVFGAAALRRLGYAPLLVDLFPDPGLDDDHVLAIFSQHGRLGAVAKSNFAGLRFREPVYHGLRELVMSYFDWFYNVDGVKTLRSYTRPLRLETLDQTGWMWRDAGVDVIEKRLLALKRIPLITLEMAADLSPEHPLTYRAGMLGVDQNGLYKPKGST